MSFVVRLATEEDAPQLLELARQFSLLNLPAEKRAIMAKINSSMESASGRLPKHKSDYLFVVEDLDHRCLAGSSQLKAKNGTVDVPNYSFQVLKKERFSKSLGVGFIHQILRLRADEDGPTEIGGLVVDRSYRGRPEKVGKLISLARFNYLAGHREQFESELLAQMAPPLTDEGRSEFWEALGRRFTGMPYKEADLVSQADKEFIRSLFPDEDIYLCLLDSRARLVMGRVGSETQPALHLLEAIGFKYLEEVDPFDGGPQMGVKTEDCTLVANTRSAKLVAAQGQAFTGAAIVSSDGEAGYRATSTAYHLTGDEIVLPERSIEILKIDAGDNVCVTPMEKF